MSLELSTRNGSMSLVSQSFGTNSVIPLDRKFFLDEQQNEKCYVTATGGERISILFQKSAGNQPPRVSVENLSNKTVQWITRDNLPEELQEGISSALKTLIKTAEFTVIRNAEGECKIKLEHSERTKAVAQQFLDKQILKRELSILEESLVKVKMENFGLGSSFDANAGFFIGTFITSAMGTAAVAISGGPLTLIPALIGAIVGTVILFSTSGLGFYIEEKNKSAERLKLLLRQAQTLYEQSQDAYNRQDEATVVRLVNRFMDTLTNGKFRLVKEYSSLIFEFDEAGFNEMKSLYSEKEQAQVCAMMRLLILFSLELLPQTACPGPSIIKCLEEVNMAHIPKEIESHVLLAKGRLYLNKGDVNKALENFQKISQQSDAYDHAQGYIKIISTTAPQQPQGLLKK